MDGRRILSRAAILGQGAILLSGFFLWGSSAQTRPVYTRADLDSLLARKPATGNPVRSIEELVPLLPSELRQNVTFVYDSRSPFRTSISPAYPRVILFTDDARLVLTFTGDPAKPGHDVLETMEFRDADSRFELRTRELPAAQGHLSASARRCATCHGRDARPLFDSYPLWPGFYGSIHDTFPRGNPVGDRERKEYQAFLATTARTGVYRALSLTGPSPVYPYLDPAKFNPATLEGELSDFRFLPNTRLGMALTELNRKRLFRKLEASPRFRNQEPRLLAGLLRCDGGPRVDTIAFAHAAEKENEARLLRLGMPAGTEPDDQIDMQEMELPRELAEIDWLARASGVSRRDWSMALEPNSLSYFDGILSGIHRGQSFYLKEDFIDEMLRDLSGRYASLEPFFSEQAIYQELGYPFGHRVRLGLARKACGALASLKVDP